MRIPVQLLDLETKQPIAGGTVELRYIGPRFASDERWTDLTNEEGRVFFDVQPVVRRGYSPVLYGRAAGYENSSVYLDHALQTGREETVRVRQIRNRYGSLRLVTLEEAAGTDRVYVTFDVLDGPRAGETVRIPMYAIQRELLGVGQKFYLEQPLEKYESMFVQGDHNMAVTRLREAEVDEPYQPEPR